MSNLREPSPGPGKTAAGSYLWLISFLVFGAGLAQSFAALGIPVLYPFIQEEFGLSRTQVGFITSSYAIGIGTSVVLAGWLTDTFGVKRMIIFSLVGIAALTICFPLVNSFLIILVLAIFIGIASSPVYPASARAIMDWLPVRVRAVAMGVTAAGFPFGGTLSAALLPALALAIGWRMAAAVTGLLVLSVVLVFKVMYRDVPRSGSATRRLSLATVKTMLKNRSLVVTIVWGAAFLGLYYVVLTYFMLFLIQKLGLSAITAGGLLATAQFCSIISRVMWGAASDFIFRGRRVAVLAITGFLTVAWMLGISLMPVTVPIPLLYLMAVVIGVSTLSFHAVLTALVGEQSEPEQVGMTIGVASMGNHVCMMVMPPLFGFLVDASGSYSLAWGAAAGLALAGTSALLVFCRDPQRR
ncbi:MAG: MFS transporter [Chloroflexota bacterium]